MKENEIASVVVNLAYQIHTELGPGLFESVYEAILFYELTQMGFAVDRQKEIPVNLERNKFGSWIQVRFNSGK